LGPRTRAIVAVHNYGNVCGMSELRKLADDNSIPLIEDAAEAFGSTYAGRQVGSLGLAGAYSFQATKTLTTGEGGLVVTNDESLAAMIRLYRSHGLRRERHYWHEVPGHNFRLTNLQASIGCAQFEQIDQIIAERRRINLTYQRRLQGVPGIIMQRPTDECEPLIWATAVRLDPEVYPQGRDDVMAQLLAAGIETRPGFQPPAEMSYFESGGLPICEVLGRWVLSLPSPPTLEESQIDRVCGQLHALGRPQR
jgi:perosamine synthetase